jgi:hypothetical protein
MRDTKGDEKDLEENKTEVNKRRVGCFRGINRYCISAGHLYHQGFRVAGLPPNHFTESPVTSDIVQRSPHHLK